MRRAVFLFALALALAFAPPQTRANEPISPALFVARDADSTMYLFGTVHVRRRGAAWGGADAQAALAEADEVWTEVLITPEIETRTRALVAELGMAPPDRPLSSWLSDEENERLREVLQRLGAPPGMFEPMQPWIAGLTLSVLPLLQAGYDPAAGVDRAIDAIGDAEGKSMRALETIDDQMHLLAGLSADVQRQMLLEAIDTIDSGAARLDEMSAVWEAGDLDALERAVLEELRVDYPELYDAVFVRRNAAWTEILLDELEGAGVDFVAVGAGHLLGPDGVVAMLQARGVSVERVQ